MMKYIARLFENQKFIYYKITQTILNTICVLIRGNSFIRLNIALQKINFQTSLDMSFAFIGVHV